MSEIKVNSIKGVGASAAAITVNNSDGTCTANLTNKPNRNLIINGAMQVAQRGTSSTSSGYYTVDRFRWINGGIDNSPTQAQVDVASGTTPYTLGFRKSYRVTNANQTSGAQGNSIIRLQTKLEAQDIANSGWNYTSTSSFITFSFWIKSSVAQEFYGYIYSQDGSQQSYIFSTGSLSANTWTKVTKTIPGNSNLQFDNDNETGLNIQWQAFMGTTYTDNSATLNQWGAWNSSVRVPDMTSTWYTTNGATLEITGVQLEVGSVATDFEHRSFAQELALCERYYQTVVDGTDHSSQYFSTVFNYTSGDVYGTFTYRTTMRTIPSLEQASGSNYYYFYGNGAGQGFSSFAGLSHPGPRSTGIYTTGLSTNQGGAGGFTSQNASAKVALSAEL